jgi:cysteine desulfurase/selenocysteine lyase
MASMSMLPEIPTFNRDYEFPFTRKLTYLNNASHIPLPTTALNCMMALYDELRDGVVEAKRHYVINDLCRDRIAQYIVSTPQQIALMHNTGEGLNTALWGLDWRAGDEILTPENEFPSAVYPLLNMAQHKGLSLRFVSEPWTVERLQAAVGQKTRGLVFSWVHFAHGEQRDLAKIGIWAREHGIYTIVDATQGLGQLSLNLSNEPVDIICCGAQKWLAGPMGAGFMWLRRELVTALDPPYYYWLGAKRSMDFEDLTEYDHPRFADARRYEGGTYAHADIYAFAGSLGMLLAIGAQDVSVQAQALAEIVRSMAQERGITINLPAGAEPSAIVSLAPPRAAEIKKLLEAEHIATSLRAGCIRVSPYFYNTPEEISHLFAVIDKLI